MGIWGPFMLLAVVHGLPEREQQVRLDLQCRDAVTLVATLHNDGTTDTSVRLGTLRNGTRQLVDNVRVLVRPQGEPEHFRIYRPRDYPVGGSFALREWTVPLPAAGSYTMRLPAQDFEGWRTLTSFPTATLKLRWVVVREGSTDALVSNDIHVPDDCP